MKCVSSLLIILIVYGTTSSPRQELGLGLIRPLLCLWLMLLAAD